jgi:NADH:ubiquinone oxidoreductase subunit F (NADH-binding)
LIAPGVEVVAVRPRLLIEGLPSRESLADYIDRGGYASTSWERAPAELREEVDLSGLRGRGGGAFPTGRKWKAVAAEPGPRAALVNGAESEPASQKDRLLLTLRPHLVIEGALLAARAVGARECVFYLHQGAHAESTSLHAALTELRAAGRPLPRWRLVLAPRGYVAGEESAAVQRCNGKAAKPTFKPPMVYQRGIGGRPTLVNNVETLAQVPFIARRGAAAFRAVGSAASPGTLLVTLSGAIRRPAVHEIPFGAPLARVLNEVGGGTPDGAPIQAVLPGGYFAGWLAGRAIDAGVLLDGESLARHGVGLGAGAITVVPASVCGLAQAAALLRFFVEESVQQCGPCTFGTAAMAEALERIVEGAGRASDLERLGRYAEAMLPGRGACGHLDGAAAATRTALKVFERDLDLHLGARGCGRPAQVLLPGLGRPRA